MDDLSPTEAIATATALFQHMLKRLPTVDEGGALAKKLHGGASFGDIMGAVASTPEYVALNAIRTRWPNGHYHSPVVDPSGVAAYLARQRTADLKEIRGTKFESHTMVRAFEKEAPWLRTLQLPHEKAAGRYYEAGSPFPLGDAYTLAAIMHIYQPKRIIEIGSGFSTACMLDIADHMELATNITCIEPFPARLKMLLRPADEKRVTLISDLVQNVPLSLFMKLNPGDVLFIDSSHVLKTGSDVHYELFNILPIIKPGVVVHFHDCPYPFEYPDKWVFDWNHSWNEVYALRAFLMFNTRFSVLMWPSMLKQLFTSRVIAAFPEFTSYAASSIWIS
jgi:hypothetical protein